MDFVESMMLFALAIQCLGFLLFTVFIGKLLTVSLTNVYEGMEPRQCLPAVTDQSAALRVRRGRLL